MIENNQDTNTSPPSPIIPNSYYFTEIGINLMTGSYAPNPVFSVTYNNNNNMAYPTASGGTETYYYPDNIIMGPPQTTTYESSSATVIESQSDYENYISASINVEGDGELLSAGGSGSILLSQTLSISNEYVYALCFGGSIVATFARQFPTSGTNQSLFTQAFVNDVRNLPSNTASNWLQAYNSFFSAYGTHYIDSASLGGVYVMMTSLLASAVNGVTKSEISTAVSTEFGNVVASGELSTSGVSSSASFMSNAEITFWTQGGGSRGIAEAAESISSFQEEIPANPVVVANPAIAQRPLLVPLSNLFAYIPDVPTSTVEAFNAALAIYLAPDVSLIGQPQSASPNTPTPATSDGFLSAWSTPLVPSDGMRASYQVLTDSSVINPTTARAQFAFHLWTGSMAHITGNMATVPVRKGDGYNFSIASAPGSSGAVGVGGVFTPMSLPDGFALGEWLQVANGTTSGQASSDGFLVVTLSTFDNGVRGYVLGQLSPPSGGSLTTYAATGIHYWYNPGNIFVNAGSFTLPVPSGYNWNLAFVPTFGMPALTVYWIPITSQSPGATLLQAPQSIGLGNTNTAPTDGFIVGMINCSTQSAGLLATFAGPSGGGAGPLAQVAQASAQYLVGNKLPNGIPMDIEVLYSSSMYPVSVGTQFAAYVAPSPVCSATWFGLKASSD